MAPMIKLDDIHSLTDFQRETSAHMNRLKRTGRPAILTVNGKARVIVQDAGAYQKLLDRIEDIEKRLELAGSIREFRAGQVRDVDAVFDDLEARYETGGKPTAKRARRR